MIKNDLNKINKIWLKIIEKRNIKYKNVKKNNKKVLIK